MSDENISKGMRFFFVSETPEKVRRTMTAMREKPLGSVRQVTAGCKVRRAVYEALRRIAVNRGISVSDLLREQITRLLAEQAQNEVNEPSAAGQSVLVRDGKDGGADDEDGVHGGDAVERDGDGSESDGAGDVPVPRHDFHDGRTRGPVRHRRVHDVRNESADDTQATNSMSVSSDKKDKEVSQQ